MKISDAQRKAVAKYNAAKYERIEVRVPKGQKEIIAAFAQQNGESVNSFINRLINEAIPPNTTFENSGKEN